MALWLVLSSLAGARVLASTTPSTWAWGLATLRFVPPVALVLWALAVLALVPPLARRAAPALDRLGDAWTAPPRRAWPAIALFAMAAAAIVWALPDRGFFVGDFVLRLGIVREGVPYARVFPQALPLDVLIHGRLVTTLMAWTHADPLGLERVLGAARAAALAVLGVALARSLGRRAAAAAAVAIGSAATGALGLCTGYAKGLADLSLAVMAVGVLGVRVARGAGAAGTLGIVTALGIMLHRSGLALLPPWALALACAKRRGALAPRLPGTWIALGAPPVAALLVLPQTVRLLTSFDRAHLFPGGMGGWAALAAAFELHHLCDAANAIVWSAPLVPVAFAIALARPRALRRSPESAVLAALVVPWLLVAALVHPRQGTVRDWDVFVPAAVAFAVATAALVGAVLEHGGRWLAPAVALAAAAPVGALLLRAHDVGHSLDFAEWVIEAPPSRSDADRASLHQYRAIILSRDGRDREGAAEFRQAALLLPTPANLTLWLDAALRARDWSMALEALAALAERDPTPRRLLQLSHAAHALGRVEAARAAAQRAVAMAPLDPECRAWADTLGLPRAPATSPP